MLSQANRHHRARSLAGLICLVSLSFAGLQGCDTVSAGNYQITSIMPNNATFYGATGTEKRVYFQILVHRQRTLAPESEGSAGAGTEFIPANDTEISIEIPNNGQKIGSTARIQVYDNHGRSLVSKSGKAATVFKPYTDRYGMVEFSVRFPFEKTYRFDLNVTVGSASAEGCIVLTDSFSSADANDLAATGIATESGDTDGCTLKGRFTSGAGNEL